MGNAFEDLQDEVSKQLEDAAVAYLSTGLALYHAGGQPPSKNYQPAVGNLCIAVELLLKTPIARKSFGFLYANLPLEARVYLSHPETVPDAAAFRRYANDLKGFKKYRALELDPCISLFYTFFPGEKNNFRPYLSLVSKVRNPSVHAVLPTLQSYDLHRVAYLALKLLQHLVANGIITEWAYLLSTEDKAFLTEFDEERVERVKKAVEAAEKKATTLEHLGVRMPRDDDWEVFTTQCPVCASDGILYGSTDVHGTSEDDVSLDFEADSFKCEDCGLSLDDVEELRLAGMGTAYDRGDEWDDWMAEQAYEE